MVTEILISTECAPKLGHPMYDPLSMEAAEFENIDEDFLSNDSPTLSLEDESTLTINSETTLSLLKNNYVNEYATETTTQQKRTIYEFEITPKETFSKRPKNTINLSPTLNIDFNPTRQKAYTTTSYVKPRIFKILRGDDKCESTKTCDASAYGFDATTCKIVNDRILCGYDKNIGEPQDYNVDNIQKENIDPDCIIKWDRIECGYGNPPFTGIRRPSPLRANSNYYTPQIRNKRNDTLETLTKIDTAAMTETTTETTEFTTEIITTTSIPSLEISSETTLAASQRNDNEVFTTSSIDIDAYTPSSTPSSTTNSITSNNTSTETTLAALRRDDNKNTIGNSINNDASSNTQSSTHSSTHISTHISTSNSTSRIDIDTYIPSRKAGSTEETTESSGTMKCVEKDDRIVCYDLE